MRNMQSPVKICNAIEALTEDAFSVGADQETGLVDFDFDDVPGHDAALLIDALVIGMQSLSEQYSEFIHFEIEEV